MKIKVMKRENDIIIEYTHEKNPHEMRYKILEFLIKTANGNIIIYVDTNSKLKVMPISDIENMLNSADIKYECEAIESSKQGMFGFSQMFRSNKKEKKLTEHIILAEISSSTDLKELYDGLLCNYDYAVGIGNERPISELILRLKSKIDDVLFNKGIFKNTVYDSIVLKRTRMDYPYESFAVFADTLLDV